jgi:hypothetical protein
MRDDAFLIFLQSPAIPGVLRHSPRSQRKRRARVRKKSAAQVDDDAYAIWEAERQRTKVTGKFTVDDFI